MQIPRFVISGLSGGAGKTLLSLGLARIFARRDMAVRAFKKGPDYIDAAWLAKAARSPQANLDPFFSPGRELLALFQKEAHGYDLALLEGNRGLFDGLDINGSCSTAEVARILRAPVILIVDCTKMTRTVAAVVKGCIAFEEGVRIGGVILNRTGNDRHQNLARRAVEELCGVPVLGALARRAEPFILERHMGLAGMEELGQADALLDSVADFIEQNVDTARILGLASSAPALADEEADAGPGTSQEILLSRPQQTGDCPKHAPGFAASRPRIGYVSDEAFWFYYYENLQALENAGACLVPLSLLSDSTWPEIDGLYLGGGLPELYAQELSNNTEARKRVAALAESGLPVYAECGGFMYLARHLITGGQAYPMAGVFPVDVRFHARPQGLGYVEAESVLESPFHPLGSKLKGHEFHFSGAEFQRDTPRGAAESAPYAVFRLSRGKGMFTGVDERSFDGLQLKNTFASYMHIYAPAVPHWAPRFVALCQAFRLNGNAK